ncbi:Flowering time control protein FCA [Vitis vinifera]|uniref:Flowering time control protein FCA n=1 Tax=Vitis vinifera TaxID=29760 RepID=A0A438IXN0_VITVI|nr:Flowering time control protein FCA [Vitis vinifera]
MCGGKILRNSAKVFLRETGSNPQTVASTGTLPPAVLPSIVSSSPAVCASSETADLLECDWSEHICPDGFKYYYNCETCESRWEKPEEYILFLQQLPKHQQLQNPSGQQCQSPCHSQVLSTQQNFQTRIVPLQTELSHQKLHSPSSSSPAGILLYLGSLYIQNFCFVHCNIRLLVLFILKTLGHIIY